MLTIGIITSIIVRTVTKNSELFTRLTIGTLVFSILLSFQTYNITPSGSIAILGGLFHSNALVNALEMYLLIVSTLLVSFILGRNESFGAEYRIIIVFSILGMITLIQSFDLISTFLAIELQSLSLYVIASIARKEATAAGLKYFLLGSLSSAFFLFGLVIVYSWTGITQYDGLNMIYATTLTSHNENNMIATISIIFITIGLLFKIGAAPFHNWAPDVYDNVPTLVTSWLAIMGKLSILSFVFILKTTTGIFIEEASLSNTIFTLLTLSATLSLLIGSILGLVQYRIKRLLAYSSIGHLGYLLIGLSIDSGLAVSSFLFYMFQYWLSLICIFAILLYCDKEGNLRSVASLRIYTSKNPALIIAMIINLFSLTGIPPLIGFFGKQMILHTLLEHGYYLIATIAICTSVISAAYYLRIVKTLGGFSPQSLDSPIPGAATPILAIPSEGLPNNTFVRPLSWIISIITLIILSVFQTPNLLLNFTHGFAVWSIIGI